jgi:hypothetical protein
VEAAEPAVPNGEGESGEERNGERTPQSAGSKPA